MIHWLLVAQAATLTVPGDHADLVDAVDAAQPGDVIEVGPGVWTGPFLVYSDLTIRSTDGPAATILQGFSPVQATVVASGASLDLQGVTVACGPVGGLVATDALVRVSDGVFSSCEDAIVASVTGLASPALTLDRVTLTSLPTASPAIEAVGAVLALTDVGFEDAAPGTEPLVAGAGGSWTFTDVSVEGVHRSSELFVGVDIAVDWTRVRVSCSSAGAAVASLDATTASVGPLLVWNTTTDLGGALLEVGATGTWDVGFSTLVGASGGQEFVRATRGVGIVRNTVFAGAGVAVTAAAGAGVVGDFNAFAPDVTPAGGYADPAGVAGTASVVGDPGFVAWDPFGDCAGDVLAPQVDSALVDAGDPAWVDRDGSRSDIGATGGPDGFALLGPDRDLDGTPDEADCAPDDPARHPGAPEIAYDGLDQDCDGADLVDVDGDGFAVGADCDDADPDVSPAVAEDLGPVDRDCDGETDPTSRLVPVACATGGAGRLSWLLAAAAVCFVRRRREG